jgi:hypothetical protein
VVHLDRLDFSGDVAGSEGDDHAGLDSTGLDTADGNCADTADLVHILEGKTEGPVAGAARGLDGVNGVEEGLALDETTLGLLGPALVPAHVGRLLEHVVTVPARDGDERNVLGVVADLLDEGGRLLNDFLVTRSAVLEMRANLRIHETQILPRLGPLGGVHLVDGNDELPDTEGESEKGVLAGLAILGDTSLELASAGSNDEDSAVSLRSTSDHV